MNHVLSSHEILGILLHNGEEMELVASAEAVYEPESGRVCVELDSFLRPTDLRQAERHEPAPWLPAPQCAREGVDRSEASDLAKDVFHRWVAHVRLSFPGTLHTA